MTAWDKFFSDRVRKIFTEKNDIVDIGGGLRMLKDRGNRYNPDNEWIALLAKNVSYRIMDPVPDYKPDIIGDIHAMPFGDSTLDAVICIAVLEHVENPHLACQEMLRVLKPGGHCLVYVPFLYYYHAEVGYYHDYWRFSTDALDVLFKDFSHKEKIAIRGPYETLIRLTPFDRYAPIRNIARWFDRRFKPSSRQVSGYYVFLTK